MWDRTVTPLSVGTPTEQGSVLLLTMHRKNTIPSYKDSTLVCQLAKATTGKELRRMHSSTFPCSFTGTGTEEISRSNLTDEKTATHKMNVHDLKSHRQATAGGLQSTCLIWGSSNIDTTHTPLSTWVPLFAANAYFKI